MAGPANSLTADASGGGALAPVGGWTAPATDLRVFLAALAALGYETAALIATAHLTGINVDDPDARVPCETYGALFGAAQQQRFTPNLATALARHTPLGAYPLLDYLVLTSETAGAGIRQLARYYRLVSNPLTLDDIREDGTVVEVRMIGAAGFGVEYLASLMAFHLRQETDGRFALARVMLRHRPDDAAAMAEALGCEVEPFAAWDGVCISHESWHLPLRRRDPVLRRVLETHADQILERLPKRTGVALEVQRALSRQGASDELRIESIARQLAMSVRTLQRRLAAEGVSFQELIEEIRKEAAARYVASSSLSLAEIAYLVGYSEPAPFHRAFKRWYGVTPETYRSHYAAP